MVSTQIVPTLVLLHDWLQVCVETLKIEPDWLLEKVTLELEADWF